MSSLPRVAPEYNSEYYDLTPWREWYQRVGVVTLPLEPNSKKCLIRGWPEKSPFALWARAKPGANIGVRGGDNSTLVVDCDALETAELVRRWLDGLGLPDPPQTVTRRALHAYIRTDIPEGLTHWKLAIGPGEAIGPHSLVVAAPSVVNDWTYTPAGQWSGGVPYIAWPDVSWLLRPRHTPTTHRTVIVRGVLSVEGETAALYTDLIRGQLPAGALELAAAIRLTPKGEPVLGYARSFRSRSEALAALWHQTLDAGYSPREAAAVVGSIPGRPVRTIEADAKRVYDKIYQSREEYRLLAEKVATFAFPGRADRVRTDARVLRAAALLAFQKGGGYMLHSGEIGIIAGLSRNTTKDAMRRLAALGYLRRTTRRQWRGFLIAHRVEET